MANRKNIEIEKPTEFLIEKYAEEFDNKNGLDENTIKLVFCRLSDNTPEAVLARVIVLNQLYSTRLNSSVTNKTVDVRKLAEYLFNHRSELNKCETADEVIGWINEKQKKWHDEMGCNFPYSFMTKYCSWHFPELNIPIVDRYTKGMLYYLNKQTDSIYFSKFIQNDLNDYQTYCDIYKAFEKKYAEGFPYKTIDKYLWKYGKEKNIFIN